MFDSRVDPTLFLLPCVFWILFLLSFGVFLGLATSNKAHFLFATSISCVLHFGSPTRVVCETKYSILKEMLETRKPTWRKR